MDVFTVALFFGSLALFSVVGVTVAALVCLYRQRRHQRHQRAADDSPKG
jgi:hypothetical protein